MKLTNFEIKRTASYETPPSQLQALATLMGPSGAQTLVLSTSSIVAILKIIEKDAARVAAQNALMVAGALQEAGAEVLLESPDATLQLGV